MENGPLEDVFPIRHGDFPASYVSLPEGNLKLMPSNLSFGITHFPYTRIESLHPVPTILTILGCPRKSVNGW